MRPDDVPEPEPEGEDDELHPGHHGDERLHGQVRGVQEQLGHEEGEHRLLTVDVGHGRSGHGGEDREESEIPEISSDSSREWLDFDGDSEGQNRAQDVDEQ